MARSKEEWDVPSASAGGDTDHLAQEKSGTREASVPQRAGLPQRCERAAQAAGAEVMQRERRPRLALFRGPQLEGPRRRGRGGGGGSGRSLECSNVTDGPQLSQRLEGRHKSRNSKGCLPVVVVGGYNGASWVYNLGLQSYVLPCFSGRVGRLQLVGKGAVWKPVDPSRCLP